MTSTSAPLELIPASGFVIEFPDVSDAEAGRNAAELRQVLKNELEDARSPAQVDQLRIIPDSQDLGTVIAIILGAKASVAAVKGLAKGFEKWFSRPNQGRIRIRTRAGDEIFIDNIASKDISKIIETII
jgi:hypothetical protein